MSAEQETPHWGLYLYPPTVSVAFIALAILAAITIFHLYQFIRLRAWVLSWLLLGALLECIGFAGRAWSVVDKTAIWPFLAGYLIPIIAPSFLAAACYMVFGRIVWAVTPVEKLKTRVLLVPPRWITPIFVVFDLGSFFVQLIGVGVVAGSFDAKTSTADPTKSKQGTTIVKFGLILQMVCFGLFTLVGVNFLVRSRRWLAPPDMLWKRLTWAVNCSATLIMLRAFYRMFEFSAGTASKYLTTHEWCFYAFDALPIFCSLAILNVLHPGKCLPKQYTGFRLAKKSPLVNRQWYSGEAYSLVPPQYSEVRVLSKGVTV